MKESEVFAKLREVGFFLLLGFILGLRAIQMDGVFGVVNGRVVQSQNFGTEC